MTQAKPRRKIAAGSLKGLLHFKIFAQDVGLHFPEMPLHIVRRSMGISF